MQSMSVDDTGELDRILLQGEQSPHPYSGTHTPGPPGGAYLAGHDGGEHRLDSDLHDLEHHLDTLNSANNLAIIWSPQVRTDSETSSQSAAMPPER